MPKLKAAVLISGSGSNLQALLEAASDPDYPTEIAVVISNRPDAYGLERAKNFGVETLVIDHKAFPDRASFEAEIDLALNERKIGIICLAGFMRILNADFVNKWRDRIINIHPSLLPSFKGLNTHQRALDSGVKIHGCTVHIVRAELDDGPIIIQAAVSVEPDDTSETLAQRVLEYEHLIYPEALRLLGSGEARISGDQVQLKTEQRTEKGLISPTLNFVNNSLTNRE